MRKYGILFGSKLSLEKTTVFCFENCSKLVRKKMINICDKEKMGEITL